MLKQLTQSGFNRTQQIINRKNSHFHQNIDLYGPISNLRNHRKDYQQKINQLKNRMKLVQKQSSKQKKTAQWAFLTNQKIVTQRNKYIDKWEEKKKSLYEKKQQQKLKKNLIQTLRIDQIRRKNHSKHRWNQMVKMKADSVRKVKNKLQEQKIHKKRIDMHFKMTKVHRIRQLETFSNSSKTSLSERKRQMAQEFRRNKFESQFKRIQKSQRQINRLKSSLTTLNQNLQKVSKKSQLNRKKLQNTLNSRVELHTVHSLHNSNSSRLYFFKR